MLRQTLKRIVSILLALVLLCTTTGQGNWVFQATHAEEMEQEISMAEVAWLYLHYAELDQAQQLEAYANLNDAEKSIFDQLQAGALVLCQDSEGLYYTKLPTELEESDNPATSFAGGVVEAPEDPLQTEGTITDPSTSSTDMLPTEPAVPTAPVEGDVGAGFDPASTPDMGADLVPGDVDMPDVGLEPEVGVEPEMGVEPEVRLERD